MISVFFYEKHCRIRVTTPRKAAKAFLAAPAAGRSTILSKNDETVYGILFEIFSVREQLNAATSDRSIHTSSFSHCMTYY